jgi:SAM-dependent methyltransferase
MFGGRDARSSLYDRVAADYVRTRREDPRIARQVHAALGDAESVVNVGAGAGAYEPRDRLVVAVEPSPAMIAQRPPGSAAVIRARAESLPFDDSTFDAAMAVLSVHHFEDPLAGLREMRRVARRRVVVLTFDPEALAGYWLSREYLPGYGAADRAPGPEELARVLGGARIERVPVPHDCRDGFYAAFWRRPEAYLDPRVRAGMSIFARLERGEVERGLARLRADVESGEWARRHRSLLFRNVFDPGYRLIVAERRRPG